MGIIPVNLLSIPLNGFNKLTASPQSITLYGGAFQLTSATVGRPAEGRALKPAIPRNHPRHVPTRVSNPVRSPGFRPSPSGAFQPSAFATGGPPGIIGFRPYPGSTLGLSRPLARQYPPASRVEPETFRGDLPGRLRPL